jgi:hypothetical protein
MLLGGVGAESVQRFFLKNDISSSEEQEVVSYAGKDSTGGLVAAILFEKAGRLSQLEFYSIDGHEPWFAPKAEDLEPYV